MNPINRRTAMATAMVAGASSFTGLQAISAQESEPTEERSQDEKFVMEAGMTREEADCWKKTAEAAGAFFNLPELHPMDKQEVATAIHVLQNKLLGRPTYRKYLKLAKAAHENKNEKEKKE